MFDSSKIRFDKNGLVPMIIQDADSGIVLSLFYADQKAIEKMEKEGFVWRFSRSKNKLMKKGEESGFFQKVVSISQDCDSDTLLVLVEPRGPACHKGTVSCFGSPSTCFQLPVLKKLEQVIEERAMNPKKESYTCKLFTNNKLLESKLVEELDELLNFTDKKNLTWEVADLLYFIIVFLKKNNGNLRDVEKELSKRLPEQGIE